MRDKKYRLTKADADKLMEKFSKLTPTSYSIGRSANMVWESGGDYMELSMFATIPWELRCGTFYKKTTLNFEAFPLFQRIRLYRFFNKMMKRTRKADAEAERLRRHEGSIATAKRLLEDVNA